jgi:ABC-type cobalamin/Fe3+-siderophores transport system ATPase subunit
MAGITSITVAGFKSFYEKQTIEIRPLTVLAGVNSSGKSSIMQPLLLLKQTIEAPYDPGALLLDGPNVSVTRIEQVLSRGEHQAKEFTAGYRVSASNEQEEQDVSLTFGRAESGEVRVVDATVNLARPPARRPADGPSMTDVRAISAAIGVIHLPALRGNPQRHYRTAAVHGEFRGVFNDYTAGVIAEWQNRARLLRPGVLIREGKERLAGLTHDLELLGLTWHVEARQVDDANVELLVDRLPRARQDGSHDLVNIADVGFGVSQTLPVVVALQVAAPDQLVYLEQPEIHLHPRAQVAFAELLRSAVNRGARVVVETHSALLLLAIQTMVAKGTLDVGDVALHWFSRDPNTGLSKVTSATLDRFGAFGDWPEDFDEVDLQADHDFLTAVENAEAEADSQ